MLRVSEKEALEYLKAAVNAVVQIDNGVQTLCCYQKYLLHECSTCSRICSKATVKGGYQIAHALEGYGFLCIASDDNKLVKI